MRGLIGSDILRVRPDWRVIENPFTAGDAIVAIPAIRPDIALFHAAEADRDGNVWIGRRRELALMAYAAQTSLVTVERIRDTSLLDDEVTAAGVLPALYVGAIAHVPKGASPYGLWGEYPADTAEIARYAEAAPQRGRLCRLSRPLPRRARLRMSASDRERLIATVADVLDGVGHVAVGASSPIPAAGAMLRRALDERRGRAVRSRSSARRATTSSPTAAPSCSTARRRGGSTPSSSAADRSTARATSTSSAPATIRAPRRAGPAPSARASSITSCRA